MQPWSKNPIYADADVMSYHLISDDVYSRCRRSDRRRSDCAGSHGDGCCCCHMTTDRQTLLMTHRETTRCTAKFTQSTTQNLSIYHTLSHQCNCSVYNTAIRREVKLILL